LRFRNRLGRRALGWDVLLGTVVPRGGFDSILRLFNASIIFIDDKNEGTGVATDPKAGLTANARSTETLTPGQYIAALTKFDNFSIGNHADGFAETGDPNFTANSTFTSGGAYSGNII
jgi:hypothetical protein